MAKNYVQDGFVLDYTATSDIASGGVVTMGGIIGIALVDIPTGETGSVRIDGVFRLAKTGGTAWSQGDALRWDVSASQFTRGGTAATGDVTGAAVAAAPAASADTEGLVLLRAIPGTVT